MAKWVHDLLAGATWLGRHKDVQSIHDGARVVLLERLVGEAFNGADRV